MERKMGGMRSAAVCTLFGLCLLTTALIGMSHPSQELTGDQKAAESASRHKPVRMSSIFDFDNYRRLFKRTYSGIFEISNRMKLFFARALRVFIAAVKYKHAKQSYYLAINCFSDATLEELDRMRNRVLDEELGGSSGGHNRMHSNKSAPGGTKSGTTHTDEASLKEILREYPAEVKEFSSNRRESQRRKKRSPENADQLRELHLDRLINAGQDPQPEPEGQGAAGYFSSSYNPFLQNLAPDAQSTVFDPFINNNMFFEDSWSAGEQIAPDAPSTGSGVPIDPFSNWPPPPQEREPTPGVSELAEPDIYWREVTKRIEKGYWVKFPTDRNEPQLPDEVFYDLRTTSKCFLPPRNQGRCGSCYAHVTTTIVEWLFCMKIGSLVAFSEQYMIDCGNGLVPWLNGCIGGSLSGAAQFIENFGLEPYDRYPYRDSDGPCPYDRLKPPSTMGVYRVRLKHMFAVSVSEMVEVIARTPIILNIAADNSFLEYGGGVYNGVACDATEPLNYHGVVLVGHGRENGREYWLIRNSWGTGWGEGGYYKLDKETDSICGQIGSVLATENGRDFDFDVSLNRNNQFGTYQKFSFV